jgi:hypothetical protein
MPLLCAFLLVACGGEAPAGLELDEIVAELPEGGFAVVADPGTGETATLASSTPTSASSGDVVSDQFSVAVEAGCTDCGDPSCTSMSRTIEISLSQDSGPDDRMYGVQTVTGSNYNSPSTTPSTWVSAVGSVVELSTTGTLSDCVPFAHYFDVVSVPWRHTITVDGDLGDWFDAERFETSQGDGTSTYVTWDDDTLFVGIQHPDVSTGGPSHWMVVTLGNGEGGATVGTTLNTQTPGLPFGASTILRVNGDGSYSDILTWNGSEWVVQGAPTHARDVAAGTAEISVPLADAGLGDHIELHVNWVFEGDGFESSYAATPEGSFDAGYDPDYGQYFAFDRSSSAAPTTYDPLP